MGRHRRGFLDLPPASLHPADVVLLVPPDSLPRPGDTQDPGGRAVVGVRMPAGLLDTFAAPADAVGAAWVVVLGQPRRSTRPPTIGRLGSGVRVASVDLDPDTAFEVLVDRISQLPFRPAPAGTSADAFVWLGLVRGVHAVELRADFDAAAVDTRGLRHALAHVVDVLVRAARAPHQPVATLGLKSTAELEDSFGAAPAPVTAPSPGG